MRRICNIAGDSCESDQVSQADPRRASVIFMSPDFTACAKSGACSLIRLASLTYWRFVPRIAAACSAASLVCAETPSPIIWAGLLCDSVSESATGVSFFPASCRARARGDAAKPEKFFRFGTTSRPPARAGML
jgi:hypothetical protein